MNWINYMEQNRKNNIQNLAEKFPREYRIVLELFEIGEEIGGLFDFSNDLLRISGLVFGKGLIIAKSSYSLIIDGNGQEAGALLRVLIESVELLTYLYEDNDRINQVIENRLPSPGERAKKINGNFKELRKYLNKNASHFEFSYHSLNHLIDYKNNKLKIKQSVSDKVLRENLNMICTFTLFLYFESIKILSEKLTIPKNITKKLYCLKQKI